MQSFSRRTLIGPAVIAGGLALLEYLRRQGGPPPADWVRDSLWGDELVAYAIWNGRPRAALLVRDKRLAYDLMIPGDWFWPNWPPRPQWQLAGLGYSIAASDAPATVGYARCVGIESERCTQAPELFGQINDPDIVTMEVLFGDTRRRFPVAAPGFAVRLDGVTISPTGYRWLDAKGHIVYEFADPSPISPGARFRRRRQRWATPDPSPGDEGGGYH